MPTPNVPSELMVVAFPGRGRAAEVLQVLERIHQEHLVDLHAAAVISRDAGRWQDDDP